MTDSTQPTTRWMLVGVGLTIVVSMGLRYGTKLTSRPTVRDEFKMKVPIDTILESGWTIDTMLGYQEVKGPTFYWTYALGGEVVGGAMNDLRLVSSVFFVFGVVPLLLIAVRCGIRGPPLLGVAVLWCLVPYNAFLGQLLFSEPTFNAIGMWAFWAYVWGTGAGERRAHPIAGPLLVCVCMTLLLHHRPHAVALAGAIALTSFGRDGWRSWPWWLACLVAGLLRVPLWNYWGGLVTSHYQGLFGFGIRLDSAAYLLAVVAVVLWPLTIPAWRDRIGRMVMVSTALVSAIVGAIVAPDLTSAVTYTLPGREEPVTQIEYAGIIATVLKTLAGEGIVRACLFGALAGAGGASLAALGVIALHVSEDGVGRLIDRLAFWTLTVGLPLYVVTSGPVYDRYLAVWITMLPLVWVRHLPRWLLAIHGVQMVVMAGYSVGRWLF